MLPSTSIIIPVLNEAKNLLLLVEKLSTLVDFFLDFEVIIVDDNSQDESEEILSSLTNKHPWLHYIIRHAEPDLSQSVLLGLKQAQNEVLVVMDADLSHSPEDVSRLVAMLQNPEIDFVIGSRFVNGSVIDKQWPMLRRLNAWVAKLLVGNLIDLDDALSGFFCLRRAVFNQADQLTPIGYKIALELMIKCRCKHIVEVPIHFHQRHEGKSKLNLKQRINYLRHLKRLYQYKYSYKNKQASRDV